MAKVFLVTAGEYSDYRVVCAYSEDKKQDAESIAALMGGRVEEYELNKEFTDPKQDFFVVDMDREGKSHSYSLNRLDDDGEPHKSRGYFETNKDRPHEPSGFWKLHWSCYANSEEHAVKITNEKRMQILAGQCPPGVDMGKNAL